MNAKAQARDENTLSDTIVVGNLDVLKPDLIWKEPIDAANEDNHTASPYPHLDNSVVPCMSESGPRRIERILKDTLILHSRLAALLNEVQWLVAEPVRMRARGVIITGDPGAGKTAICKMVRNAYPVDAVNDLGQHAPKAIAMSLSGARTAKSLLLRVLEATRSPTSGRQTIYELERVVKDILRAMPCRLLIFDEVQDVLSARESEQLRVFEVIKLLMNELSLPVLCLGTQKAERAFKADPHLNARFQAFEIPAWEEGDDFASFLRVYERFIPLKCRSDLAQPGIQKVLIRKGRGVIGPMIETLQRAAVNAVADGTEVITAKSLEEAQLHPSVSFLSRNSNSGKS